MTRWLWTCCAALLVGCGSVSNVHFAPQALQTDDPDLSSLQHQLVMFTVHIQPASAGLQLRAMRARNLATQDNYSFPFFSNVILKSKELPYAVAGDVVEHTVLLDLPEGRYAVRAVDFTPRGSGGSVTSLTQVLSRPIEFDVRRGRPVYLGRLDVVLGSLRVVETFRTMMADQALRLASGRVLPGQSNPTRSLVDLSTEVNKLAGDVAIVISRDEVEDVQKAKHRYRALADQTFAIGGMAFGAPLPPQGGSR